MNINFCAAAQADCARTSSPAIWQAALQRGGEAYDTTTGKSVLIASRATFNVSAADGIWTAPSWINADGGLLGLSPQPTQDNAGHGEHPIVRHHFCAQNTNSEHVTEPTQIRRGLWSAGKRKQRKD